MYSLFTIYFNQKFQKFNCVFSVTLSEIVKYPEFLYKLKKTSAIGIKLTLILYKFTGKINYTHVCLKSAEKVYKKI
jgi:hypothetical protein